MARVLHWVGVFLLLVSACLLLVTTITAPVIPDIAILKVYLTNQTTIRHSSVTFGTFGHCILDVPPDSTDQDFCFPKSIGYKPAVIMSEIDGTGFDYAASTAADGLTNAMILHPIACAVTFIALLCACLPSFVGAILGSAVTALAWLLTLVVMAIDFALFGIIKNHVNKDGSGNHAVYSIGMWTCLAAMVLLFFAMFIVLFSCFSSRRDRKNGGTTRTSRRSEKHYSSQSHHSHRRSNSGGRNSGGYSNGGTRRHY